MKDSYICILFKDIVTVCVEYMPDTSLKTPVDDGKS